MPCAFTTLPWGHSCRGQRAIPREMSPYGNLPLPHSCSSSTQQLFVPVPPTGDRLDTMLLRARKKTTRLAIGFLGIFILGKGQAGIWCLHLSRMTALSQGLSEVAPEELKPSRSAHRLSDSWKISCLV